MVTETNYAAAVKLVEDCFEQQCSCTPDSAHNIAMLACYVILGPGHLQWDQFIIMPWSCADTPREHSCKQQALGQLTAGLIASLEAERSLHTCDLKHANQQQDIQRYKELLRRTRM